MTSPYAMRMIVRFLNIVYTGMLKCCKLFDPVYMTVTSKKLIGNQVLASFQRNESNEIMPSRFTMVTQTTQTNDCMHSNRKFIENCAPDTTNLFTTVIRIEAMQ